MTSKGYKGHPLPAPRRLTARSVIASVLLGLDPPELGTPELVSGASVLGVNPGTARVAISRMVTAGELEPTAIGYRLAGHLLARHERQDQSRRGTTLDWDGSWRTLVVPADPRSPRQRLELRRAMGALRFAELRDGVWLRPHNLPPDRLPAAASTAAEATIAIEGTVEQPVELARTLWDLRGWAAIAEALLEALGPLHRRLTDGDATALEESFVLAASGLRHLQADPMLPTELLDPAWPGDALRQGQDDFQQQFRVVLADWHRGRRATAR